MDFSSLVLMEVEAESKKFLRELGSYELPMGGSYITKFYSDKNNIYLSFGCDRDVEEWEYSAIFYYFPEEIFKEEGFVIEDIDEEYNPSWLLTFEYKEDRQYIQERLALAGELIEEAMEKVALVIKDKKVEFTEN